MPCYTEWDAYLDKDSPQYQDARARLEAKLKAVRHIVDYYYAVEGLEVPPARHSGEPTWIEQAHHSFSIEEERLGDVDEASIIERIAHHCACDGIELTLLYDLVTLLDLRNPLEAGYARVLMTCANEMRADRRRFHPATGATEPDEPLPRDPGQPKLP